MLCLLVLFYSHALISTRWLELALAITLYFFAASMFKEVLEKEHEEKEFDEKVHKYGYITIVSLESVENATVLAALTFIDISGALIGAAISIAIIIIIAVSSKHIIARIPLDKLFRNPASNNCNTVDNLFFWCGLSTMVALDNTTAWVT